MSQALPMRSTGAGIFPHVDTETVPLTRDAAMLTATHSPFAAPIASRVDEDPAVRLPGLAGLRPLADVRNWRLLGTRRPPAPTPGLSADQQKAVLDALHGEVRTGALPGAALVMGDAQDIWLRAAHGHRTRPPFLEAMTLDTVFDLGALTQMLATTPAVLTLVDQGKLDLDAPVARYWPAFQAQGKGAITVAHLLTHRSGLRPSLGKLPAWSGELEALRRLLAEAPIAPAGEQICHSASNFMALGELVRRVSGQPLSLFARRHVFQPLGMGETRFQPPAPWRHRIAPSLPLEGGPALRGQAADPLARRMDGIAGHAGLFGTVDDLARFAQALLRAHTDPATSPLPCLGRLVNGTALSTHPAWLCQDSLLELPLHPACETAMALDGPHAFAYTGTGLWLDLRAGRFVVLLCNQAMADERGDARPLRQQVLTQILAQPHGLSPRHDADAPATDVAGASA